MRHVLVSALFSVVAASPAIGQDGDTEPVEKRGVVLKKPGMAAGYTLISPFGNGISYLIDADGQVVHQWESLYEPGLAPYLLPNGHLLRGIQLDVPARFEGGGQSGGLQEFSWDGELLWEFHFASDIFFHHHDVEPLPNGNILMIAWEAKTREQALAAGRLPQWTGDRGFWPCFVVELQPLPPFGARVVWEWHVFDHLIQDIDSTLPNYGNVWEQPERVNINGDVPRGPAPDDSSLSADEVANMEALGYLAGDDEDLDDEEKRRRERADWLHINAIDYNADLDQIALSLWHMNEIWVIDHSTTTEEARGSSGGRAGKGGDLLYRWGNPQVYQLGDESDRKLFHQHDVQWIPDRYPGAGNLTIFNNGRNRPEDEYSTVLEIVPPLLEDGSYAFEEAVPFGPETPVWAYDPPQEDRFYASFISGAHRLENGNTLVCSGPDGRVFEVDSDGEIVWDYRSPFGGLPEGGDRDDLRYGMFRATRIPPDHPGLAGRTLEPLDPQPKTVAQLLAERAPMEVESGWQDLFSEELRLSKWVDVNCARETFEAGTNPDDGEESILICTGEPTGLLRSERMYENFICEFEWRHLEEPGNAGSFLWSDPLPAVGGPFTRGIEVQICNLGNGSWFTSHGDIFPIWGAVMTPDPRFRISGSRSMPHEEDFFANPTGEWNHYRVTALDGAVTLEVNGHLVTAGRECSPKRGYLCLESEGGEVHFRNLRIWELPAGSHPAAETETATEATGHRTLYDGLDLDGFEVLFGEWQAKDWRLTCTEEMAELKVEVPKNAAQVFFDFKRPATAASLPFRLSGLEFPAEEEQPGEWHRIVVNREDEEWVVVFAGRHYRQPRNGPWQLTLANGGIATEFCSLFADQDRHR